jgi:hypothetical protein
MRTREAQLLGEGLGAAMRTFHGSAEDRRIWAPPRIRDTGNT